MNLDKMKNLRRRLEEVSNWNSETFVDIIFELCPDHMHVHDDPVRTLRRYLNVADIEGQVNISKIATLQDIQNDLRLLAHKQEFPPSHNPPVHAGYKGQDI